MANQANPNEPSPTDVAELAATLTGLLKWAHENAPAQESPTAAFLREFLGVDPLTLPSVSDSLSQVQRPDIQRAFEHWAVNGRSVTAQGINAPLHGPEEPRLATLLSNERLGARYHLGPVSFDELPSGVDTSIAVYSSALLMLNDPAAGEKYVVFLVPVPNFGQGVGHHHLEILSSSSDAASALLRELHQLANTHSVYRGKVISISKTGGDEPSPFRAKLGVTFHERTPVEDREVVLPDGLLERIQRQTVQFAQHADVLRASGRELKRGMLLFGPPGTGKTHTVRWVLARTPERTTVLVGGADATLLDSACRLARTLAPSTVVLEDVDLVAEERTMFGRGKNAMLMQLLNEMDGVSPLQDVLFILTTNRADLLEPALATRPGRVDHALEIPLPDPAARRRLLALYASDIALDTAAESTVVARTEGASASFIKELARRASVDAAIAGNANPTQADLLRALDELLVDSNALTRSLLGIGADGNAPGANAGAPATNVPGGSFPMGPIPMGAVSVTGPTFRFPEGIPAEVREQIIRRVSGDS